MDKEYLQYRAIDLFSRALPRRFAFRLAGLFAGLMFARDTKGRHAVISNLRRIMHFKGLQPGEEELEHLARQTYHNFAKYLIDFFKIRRMSNRQIEKLVTVENAHFMEEAAGYGRGAIALTAHLSNQDVACLVGSSRGHTVNLVYVPLRSPRAESLFRKRRKERGMKLIPFGKAVGAILDALRKREWVGLVGDIDFSLRDDLVDFCGAPARLPVGPARLCLKTKAPILPSFIVRRPDDTFLLRLYAPIVPDSTTTLEQLRERIRGIIEREVVESPTHWFVFVDFWNIKETRSLAIHGQ